MKTLIEKLKSRIEGEVRDDEVTRRVYSVDASIFEILPLCVVTPRVREDVIQVLQLAKEFGISVVPRGAATGITGGCLGKGIVLDFSKYMNRILKIDFERGFVICEPGVVQDKLNSVLSQNGYRLGPDTSTGNRATLGGMLANNAAGARSLKYGRMVDDVLEVEVALSSGETIHFREVDEVEFEEKCILNSIEGEIYREVGKIRVEDREEILKKFPKIPRRASGYNLDELIKSKNVNLSKIIAGSEGTLGVALEIKMRIVPTPKMTGFCVVHFDDMIEGMRAVAGMLEFNPISLEVIDDHIIEMGKQSPSVQDKLDWLIGNPAAVFVIEIEEETKNALEERLEKLVDILKIKQIGYSHVVLTDPVIMSHVWQVRKAGLGLLMSKRSYSRAVAFIEDISVGPEKLAGFLTEYKSYMKEIGKDSGIYGHAGSGCMHIRPYMDMRKEEDLKLMEKIMKDITQMLIKYGGALSGEHGDGIVRSWLNQALFGDRLYNAFVAIKQTFDPDNRMNPGKIVFPDPFDKSRRMDNKTSIHEIQTFLDFSKEGGFALAADMCNGNAQCRKSEGVMCPSFQASNDEYHTTRARAQTLRAIITGRLPMEEFTGEGLRDVLDLCIECKGCKSECPSEVDMAKMKAEFLYHYQNKHGYKMRDRLFAFIGKVNQYTSPMASLMNSASNFFISKIALSFLGIASERRLPTLAAMRFSKWVMKNPSSNGGKKVVLFNDTFTEFNVPEIGISAVKLLEALGYAVIVPSWHCCGRTLISKGFLRQAKDYAGKLIEALIPFANEKIPIIGLEPSCLYTIKDDFQGLLGYSHADLQQVISKCYTLDEFLVHQKIKLPLKKIFNNVKFHGHCHQKALGKTSDSIEVLKWIPDSIVKEIPTGCCGMAGSFGYEKEHYHFSKKIAEQQLVPSLKDLPSDTAVVANGFSCRHQIEHLCKSKPFHIAELLYQSLEHE